MLSRSDRSIPEIIALFAEYGIEAGYLVPTDTGLGKSIFDAHLSLRQFLAHNQIHDYSTQGQGESNKVILDGYFIDGQGAHPTKISLYRPETKSGDPRIWIYGIKSKVKPDNLLAFLVHEGHLHIVNTSDPSVIDAAGNIKPELQALLTIIRTKKNQVATELLSLLEGIAKKGWVKSRRAGPTGVGYTLEALLGIQANSSKHPDYKGIEIKAGRVTDKGSAKQRPNLFSQVPNWKRSPISSALELLSRYGYKDSISGRLQLFCSLSSEPNTLGHYLEIENDSELFAKHKDNDGRESRVVLWELAKLQERLEQKHNETFWIKAQTRVGSDGIEEFLYTEVKHTHAPLFSNMLELIRLGIVQLDYTLSLKTPSTVRDHGYLFKILPEHVNSLFPSNRIYKLLTDGKDDLN